MWLIWARARTTLSTSAVSPPTRKKRASRVAHTLTTPLTSQTPRAGYWSTWTIQNQRRTFSCRLSWRERSNLTRYFSCCTQSKHLVLLSGHPAPYKEVNLTLLCQKVLRLNGLSLEQFKYNSAASPSYRHGSISLFCHPLPSLISPSLFSPSCLFILHFFPSPSPLQIGGIRFLYDNLVESVERFGSSSGFGCILAHSMGLGKTLQVISFIDVLFRHTQAHTVLAIVPVSTCAFNVGLQGNVEHWINSVLMICSVAPRRKSFSLKWIRKELITRFFKRSQCLEVTYLV